MSTPATEWLDAEYQLIQSARTKAREHKDRLITEAEHNAVARWPGMQVYGRMFTIKDEESDPGVPMNWRPWAVPGPDDGRSHP